MINRVRHVPRILIAEDDTAVREFVGRALTHGGHYVDTVEDGLEALDVLSGQDYDLLITDIVMPGLSGISICKAVKSDPDLSRNTKVAVVSGEHKDGRRHALDARADQYFEKPLDIAAFRGYCSAV